MWELLIIAAGSPETTIAVARYETEEICRVEQKRLSTAFSAAMEHVIEDPDENGFTWGPGINCSEIKQP